MCRPGEQLTMPSEGTINVDGWFDVSICTDMSSDVRDGDSFYVCGDSVNFGAKFEFTPVSGGVIAKVLDNPRTKPISWRDPNPVAGMCAPHPPELEPPMQAPRKLNLQRYIGVAQVAFRRPVFCGARKDVILQAYTELTRNACSAWY